MLVPLCDCNRHFSFLPSKTLLNPSSSFHTCPFRNLSIKTIRRGTRVCASVTEAERRPLPQSAIQRIAEKLRSLGYVEERVNGETQEETATTGTDSPGEIFVPLRIQLPKYRVGHTLDPSWSTPENPVPEPGSGVAIQRFHNLRRGVLKDEEEERVRKRREGKRESAPSLAELTLPAEELRRLRSIGIGLKKKVKVGKAGITEGIVNGIHERWRRSELVKISCEDICRLNMKRTHDLLERKTGGLVIWRSGSNIILYRGSDYKYPYFIADNSSIDGSSSKESSTLDGGQKILGETATIPVSNSVEHSGQNSYVCNPHPPLVQGVGLPNRVRFQLPGEAQLAEEADALLEGLGPRFHDWWGYDPLPVDADLLPAVVPGYRRPFRLLPFGVKPKLTNDEMNTLRRLARPLPCHFALGRNRKHQGLAAAIIKLWEKCEIAKIAVKRGVQNTNSELIAEELKWLTGGTLLSRDREFITFYRGKDFLPTSVASAIEERRTRGMAAAKPSRIYHLNEEEQKDLTTEYPTEVEVDNEIEPKLQGRPAERKLRFTEHAIERTSTKLSMALAKKAKAEKLLAELEKEEISQKPEMDKEGITEEERYMLRKIGLRMKPFLLLGRRGVFDGTIENMHLHWKYRELVKVCIGRRSIEELHGIARTLEAESGGILVAVEPVTKGYAIIVYRGKNYKRPASLRPRTLLSKREAMKRSLEAQRRESLKLHVLKLSSNIDELKLKLAKNGDVNHTQLTENVKYRFVPKQEINENHNNKDPESEYNFYSGDPADEEAKSDHLTALISSLQASESHRTDASTVDSEDLVQPSELSKLMVGQELEVETSPRDVEEDYLSDVREKELQSRLVFKESKGSLNSGNVERSYSHRRSTSATSFIQLNAKGMDAGVAHKKAGFDCSLQKSTAEVTSERPIRTSQLSNKERLLLRKQALRVKKQPVFAIGKSNVVLGIAKALKVHFEKHPLAIVNVKGRAKGTSVQEVIFNLEQATGAVLVSQEPSKVILYRGWGLESKPDDTSKKVNQNLIDHSISRETSSRPLVSPELISAIRLECGLTSPREDVASEAISDGI